MKDSQGIRASILEFRQARDWPRNENAEQLVRALADEVAEAQARIENSSHLSPYDPHLSWESGLHKLFREKGEVGADLADIGIYLLALCDHFDIDLERAMARKLSVLEDKYPTEEELHLRMLAQAPAGVRGLHYDTVLSLWRSDAGLDGRVNWVEVAANLSPQQKRDIFAAVDSLEWGIFYDMSRALDKTDRESIEAVLKSDVPTALEELLTYDLELSDGQFEEIRSKLKEFNWRNLSEADIGEIKAALRDPGRWVFDDCAELAR